MLCCDWSAETDAANERDRNIRYLHDELNERTETTTENHFKSVNNTKYIFLDTLYNTGQPFFSISYSKQKIMVLRRFHRTN